MSEFNKYTQLAFSNVFDTKEIIVFKKHAEFYTTRLGNIELRFSFTRLQWFLEWFEFTDRIKCDENYWCTYNHCSLDDITNSEYCFNCPKEIIEAISAQASVSNTHTLISNPLVIEDVRKNILHDYQSLAHNGLNKKFLYRILYSTWTY